MQKITKYLCGIIQQAAKITNKSFNVYVKKELGSIVTDVVTDIDKEVESFLIGKLNQKYPEFDIVSEEFNSDHDLTSSCFVIDPIDGTKNFAVGIPLWGMQIAAIEDGEVFAAVVYLPKLNELYYADCDGAFLNGERLEISPNHQALTPVYAVENGETLTRMMENVGYAHRYIGASSVLLAWVAAGRLSGYFVRNHRVWDFVPGMYLVRMAGGYTNNDPVLHLAATNEKMFEVLSNLPMQKENTSTNTETKTAATAKPKTKTSQATKTAKSNTKKTK